MFGGGWDRFLAWYQTYPKIIFKDQDIRPSTCGHDSKNSRAILLTRLGAVKSLGRWVDFTRPRPHPIRKEDDGILIHQLSGEPHDHCIV